MDKAINQPVIPGDVLASALSRAVPVDADVPCVMLCTGKSCRKAKGFDELRRSLDALATVKMVKCVEVCDGPVAGIRVQGKTVWFERLRSAKVRVAVTSLLRLETGRTPKESKIPKRLREHRV